MTKQYNPVKVKDPTSDGHIVRLHANQPFELILTNFVEEEVEVKLQSDFLAIDHCTKDDECQSFVFKQKYDLKKWSEFSSLFLGNVTIIVTKQSEPPSEETIRLCVIVDSSNAIKKNVITAINPNGHVLKIELNQILHVVVFDAPSSRWVIAGIENVGMKCLRTETVFSDSVGDYNPQEMMCPEPRNHNWDAVAFVPDGKEYHFWTVLDESTVLKAKSTAGGTYVLGNMCFVSKNNFLSIDKKSLSLLLSLRNKKETEVDPEIKVTEPFQHYMNADIPVLLSPKFSQHMDLLPQTRTLYLELPHPSVYFGKKMDGAYWVCEAKSVLHVTELEPRYVNGIAVQRFICSDIHSQMPKNDLTYIATLSFFCKVPSDIFLIPKHTNYKKISVCLWKKTADSVSAPCAQPSYEYPTLKRAVDHTQVLQLSSDVMEGISCIPLHSLKRTVHFSNGYFVGNSTVKKKISMNTERRDFLEDDDDGDWISVMNLL
jgi:hypothetical protein